MNNSQTKYVVIVDPFSSGALLAPYFTDSGYSCIAVLSREIPELFKGSFRPEDFSATHLMKEYVKLLGTLKAYKPVAILPGSELGVELADLLAQEFLLSGNDPELSSARRDKYLMQQTIADFGIRSIKQTHAATAEQVSAWRDQQEIGYPIVIKPIASAGTDSVHLCYDDEDVAAALADIVGVSNVLSETNTAALIQEFVEGDEYIVDAVSCDGRHFTTNVCRYKKTKHNKSFTYLESEFFDPNKDEFAELVAYNNLVLDALKINFGPSHSEIILTESGPVLVEVGARLNGGNAPQLVSEVATVNPLKLVVASYTSADTFAELTAAPQQFNANAMMKFLTIEDAGEVERIEGLCEIETLASCKRLLSFVNVGDHVTPTRSFVNCPGWAILINSDPQQFYADVKAVEQINAAAIFRTREVQL
ncbi:ATP-grasp domain-containing protein [Corallincola platygyrae]|uniref:ATP-grasp domain-containing protein n=1 Tax=Corallincola platygyrae TaxID=1193278 RepID=A0ABW4XIR2_9GAMM